MRYIDGTVVRDTRDGTLKQIREIRTDESILLFNNPARNLKQMM